jgi:protein-disulfide isomerase
MTFLRHATLLLLFLCLGSFAESMKPQAAQRIEDQVRVFFTVPPQVKVILGPIKPSEFANYDALAITFDRGEQKQTFDFLLAKDGNTLLRMTKLDLSKDPYAEIMKKIDLGGRPTRGNSSSKVVAITYDDFECPFCSRMHQTLFPELLKEYGDRVVFIYKDFPLAEIHPWATRAAVDANCLAAQSQDAYWDFADYIHINQKEVNSEKSLEGQLATLDRLAAEQGRKHNLDETSLQACVKAQKDDKVEASVREGVALGVESTPTIFVNGQRLDGAQPIGELRVILDRALARAGEKTPAHPAEVSTGNAQAAQEGRSRE